MSLVAYQYILSLYSITLLIAVPWSLLLHNHNAYISRSPLFIFFNHIFVEAYGYVFFTLIYLGLLLTHFRHNCKIGRNEIIKKICSYGFVTIFWIFFNFWFFGRLIFERVNVLSGGYCEIGGQANGSLLIDKCNKTVDGTWVNGFDASGHVYFLSSSSILIWQHLLDFGHFQENFESQTLYSLDSDFDAASNFEGTVIKKRFDLIFSAIAILLLMIWYFMFVVTCIFFHTILEKVVGLIGILIPVAVSFINK